MLTAMTLATMLAQAPAETPPPPPLPEPRVHTDTSSLPLDLLNALPAPASFDYDGDQQPEVVTFGTTPTGQVTLSAKSTKTGKVQVLYTSKQSLTKLGATNVGLKAYGEPKSQVTLEVWGVKGKDKLSPLSLGLTPGAISLVADGKTYDFSWSGTGFLTKIK
ncbi:MAG TPA: hypothetical protein V6D05_06010 [Stenomitos sp.]